MVFVAVPEGSEETNKSYSINWVEFIVSFSLLLLLLLLLFFCFFVERREVKIVLVESELIEFS